MIDAGGHDTNYCRYYNGACPGDKGNLRVPALQRSSSGVILESRWLGGWASDAEVHAFGSLKSGL